MFRLINIILLASLFGSNVYAEDQVVFIKKNDPAPYDGVLFTEKKAQEIRLQLIDGDLNKDLNESYKRTVELQKLIIEGKDKQNTMLLDQNDKLAKTAYDSQKMSNWEKAGYFVGGILVTGMAVKLSHEIYK